MPSMPARHHFGNRSQSLRIGEREQEDNVLLDREGLGEHTHSGERPPDGMLEFAPGPQ